MTVALEPTITCPVCGFPRRECLRMDDGVVVWQCSRCRPRVRRGPADRCGDWFYGTTPGSPIQQAGRGGWSC